MLFSNFHIHTDYCDGYGTPQHIYEKALKKSLRSIGFSSHAPIPLSGEDWTMKASDVQNYLSDIKKVKESATIPVYTGMEIDFLPSLQENLDGIASDYGLDYYLASIHFVKHPTEEQFGTIDYSIDMLNQFVTEWFENDIYRFIESYYLSYLPLLKNNHPDILGHIDLVQKFNQENRLFDENHTRYIEAVETVIEAIAKTDVLVEVNTGAIARGHNTLYPSKAILKRLREKNVKITLNGDTHSPDYLDFYYNEASQLLASLGFKEIFYPEPEKNSLASVRII